MNWSLVRNNPGLFAQVTFALLGLLAHSSAVSQDVTADATDGVVVYSNEPYRAVIGDIESRTGYYFLYRDALVADISLSYRTTPVDQISDFVRASRDQGIAVAVDEDRRQILLTALRADAVKAVAIAGVVVDGESGDPLPYATVAWQQAGRLTGIVSDQAGRFVIPSLVATGNAMAVRFSYVGYRMLEVSVADLTDGFVARLDPDPNLTSEVVVSAVPLESEVDSVWGRVLTSSDLLLMGESNSVRALQALPAVAITGAVSGGAIVRGSRSDGFQVLLDGIPVYSPSHFFGLFDAFNSDALRAVGLYYGVSPAEFAGPPGGTVSFMTRGGSHAMAKQRFGLSTTAASATLEGPLFGGRGTWLLSGRRSILDVVDWFGNSDLISLGLDVGRESSAPPALTSLNERVLRPGESSASFFDTHGKLVLDGRSSGRWILNGYLGGDRTSQDAERFFVQIRDSLQRVVLRDVRTDNRWHNEIVGARREGLITNRGYYAIDVFASRYGSDYQKDDFPFVGRPDINPVAAEFLIDTLQTSNRLVDRGASIKIDGLMKGTTTGTAGLDFHHYTASYSEFAAAYSRTHFVESTASQLDAYASMRMQTGSLVASVGLRSHLMLGRAWWSPRIRLDARIGEALSVFGGFGRSHQFLHQLFLDTSAEARIWTLSTKEEAPGSADQVSAGFRISGPHLAFQAEGYRKVSNGIRQHETVVSRRQAREDGLVLGPWVHDYEGRSVGLELMLRATRDRVRFTSSYTLAKTELRHNEIQAGAWVAADWDRRHQFVTQLRVQLTGSLALFLQWNFGSGSPNLLSNRFLAEPDRLANYHRLDASLSTNWAVGSARVALTATVYNVYDRDNVWYRTAIGVLQGPLSDLSIRNARVDVYDLGFRPAISLSVSSL